MANKVSHTHVCPECGQEGSCASPECERLPRRLCSRCMERAWRHSRKNVRGGGPRVPRRKAA